jgi:hypothetical protein
LSKLKDQISATVEDWITTNAPTASPAPFDAQFITEKGVSIKLIINNNNFKNTDIIGSIVSVNGKVLKNVSRGQLYEILKNKSYIILAQCGIALQIKDGIKSYHLTAGRIQFKELKRSVEEDFKDLIAETKEIDF